MIPANAAKLTAAKVSCLQLGRKSARRALVQAAPANHFKDVVVRSQLFRQEYMRLTLKLGPIKVPSAIKNYIWTPEPILLSSYYNCFK